MQFTFECSHLDRSILRLISVHIWAFTFRSISDWSNSLLWMAFDPIWIVLRSSYVICLLSKSVTCLNRSQFQRHSSVHIPIAFMSTLSTKHTTRFICFWFKSISDRSQVVLERSHSDRFWVKLISGSIQLTPTITSVNTVSINTHILPANLDIFLGLNSVLKNLTGNIQKLSRGCFRQYLNEASDVLNLVSSSDFLLESLNNQSLALLAMGTTIRQVWSGYSTCFSRLYNIF